MPIPTLVTDLSTTAGSNSPAGSESPVDGDNYIRALSAFVASLAAGSATNGYTSPYLLLTGGTVSGNLTVSGSTTLNGAVTLGDAVGDTIAIGGVAWKSATGNYSFAAPSSGLAATIDGVTGAPALAVRAFSGTLERSLQSGSLISGTNFPRIEFYHTESTGLSKIDFASSTGTRAGEFSIGTTTFMSVTGNRNITFAAPSSGVGFTGTGFAGSDAFVYNGGTSGSFRVNTTGVPYGTSLHNNAGAVTGTTNQYITSGTYTPTLTNNLNVAATTARACQWIRVGNVVTVSGNCDIDPTAAAPTLTALNISLPIASTFVSGNQAGGTGSDGGSADQNGAISGNTTTVTYAYSAKSAANITHSFSFTYVIL